MPGVRAAKRVMAASCHRPLLCTHQHVVSIAGVNASELSVRQLRAQLPAAIDRAEHGETTIITRHGRPVARIAPLETPMTRTMTIFTYAIEISDDGQVWMPEGDAAVGIQASSDTAEDMARDVLDTWVDDLPEEAKGGHRRIVVWKGEQQDTIDMAVAIVPADGAASDPRGHTAEDAS